MFKILFFILTLFSSVAQAAPVCVTEYVEDAVKAGQQYNVVFFDIKDVNTFMQILEINGVSTPIEVASKIDRILMIPATTGGAGIFGYDKDGCHIISGELMPETFKSVYAAYINKY